MIINYNYQSDEIDWQLTHQVSVSFFDERLHLYKFEDSFYKCGMRELWNTTKQKVEIIHGDVAVV